MDGGKSVTHLRVDSKEAGLGLLEDLAVLRRDGEDLTKVKDAPDEKKKEGW